MRYLVDSHVLIWFRQGDRRLSKTARALLESVQHTPIVSMATHFELAAKAAKGMLKLGTPVDVFIGDYLSVNDGVLLSILSIHCRKLEQMPAHHGDPFDRMLIAQSVVESIPIVTGDHEMRKYEAQLIW